jgi:hypothetical protein
MTRRYTVVVRRWRYLVAGVVVASLLSLIYFTLGVLTAYYIMSQYVR